MRAMVLIALMLASVSAEGAAAAATEPALKDLSNEIIHGGTLDGMPPSGYSWSPNGARLAFLRKSETGKKPQLNIIGIQSATTIHLTRNPDESQEGLPITSFDWSPSGDAIVAVSSGDLYLIPVGVIPVAAPRRLTTTDAAEKDAKFSPDGAMIGFVRDHNIWVLDLATHRERRMTGGNIEGVINGEIDWVYEEEFEISSGWWWSPGSTRIAYLQFDQRMVPTYPIVDWIPTHPEVERQHYPKAGDNNAIVRVGVVDARAGADTGTLSGPPPTRWIDMGADTDIYIPRVAWTANDDLLAVQRLNRDQTHLELLLCDLTAGTVRPVVEEFDPKWINIGDDWKFLSHGDLLIWGSERDGHRHLYLYDLQGRLIRPLTTGAWDVTALSGVDAAGKRVFYISTQENPRQRQMYQVSIESGGPPRRITSGEGWHTVWVSPGGGHYVDSHSTAMNPPTITVKDTSGAIKATLDEGMRKELAAYRRGRVEFRDVPSKDGTLLPAMITLPPDFDPARRYPVLVYVYGGPHAQVVADQWGNARGLWHQMLAARGIIVWSLDNRGMGGRGHAWETPVYRDLGRQELADQLEGVAHLKTLPYVDGSRIAIWGWSYGGYMTLYSLLNSPGTFKAGVAVAPVTDWRDYDTIYTERYMDRPADNEAGYRDSSPLLKAASLADPLLLVHGSSDDNVHMQNSVQILEAFVNAGKPVEFMLYPRKNHGILGGPARTHLYEKITRFLTRYLLETGSSR